MTYRPDLLVVCRRGHVSHLDQLNFPRRCGRERNAGWCHEPVRLAPEYLRAAAILVDTNYPSWHLSDRIVTAEEVWRQSGDAWADLDPAP